MICCVLGSRAILPFGKSLKALAPLTTNLLVCIIERNNKIMVPHGDTVIQAGDILTIIAMPADAQEFFKKIGVRTNKCKDVMIVAAGISPITCPKSFGTTGSM